MVKLRNQRRELLVIDGEFDVKVEHELKVAARDRT